MRVRNELVLKIMSTSDQTPKPKAQRKLLVGGLSGKLLFFTVLFVMIGEVLIFVPSIANFRLNWLQERLASAQIASLVVQATPKNQIVSEALQKELLNNVGVRTIAVRRGKARYLMVGSGEGLTVARHIDFRMPHMRWTSVIDAFETLFAGDGRIIRVLAIPKKGNGDLIEIVLNEQPLRSAMVRYSTNILTLSLVLSALTAVLVFLSMNWLLVRPMRRLTASMVSFGDDPEDASKIVIPSDRRDEIGVAERELENMQRELSQTLHQKSRLAALGLAVSKISHDLRNMLASAQLMSDRLGEVNDPTVRHVAPKLLASLDRAIGFCANTLKYGRAQEAPPHRNRFLLFDLASEVADDLKAQIDGNIEWIISIGADLEVDADRDHLFRILGNLGRNAGEALMTDAKTNLGVIEFSAWRDGALVTITVEDNGPGLAPRARDHLFQAFHGTAKAGGTGLGLAIAAELVKAHGGDIQFEDLDNGTKFEIVIPDRVTNISTLRQRA